MLEPIIKGGKIAGIGIFKHYPGESVGPRRRAQALDSSNYAKKSHHWQGVDPFFAT